MLPLPLWFECFALLISILHYNTIRDKPLIWFIPFLAFMVVVELSGWYIKNILGASNSWLYNISIPVEYIFYTFIFYKHYEFAPFKKIAALLLLIIPIGSLINIIAIQGFYNFNTNILLAGCCIMILLCCLFFIDLFKRETEFVLLKEPMFWITTGLLFFNLGEISYNLFFDYIIKHKQDTGAKFFTSINSILVYVLYSFISIAILCTRKYRKT